VAAHLRAVLPAVFTPAISDALVRLARHGSCARRLAALTPPPLLPASQLMRLLLRIRSAHASCSEAAPLPASPAAAAASEPPAPPLPPPPDAAGAAKPAAPLTALIANIGDLQHVGPASLQAAKARMNVVFEANALKPGDPGYVYDKRVVFAAAEEASEWDD